MTDMPLWRLQRLRNEPLDLLYIESPVSGNIRLKRGVSANLRRFHSMIIRLAQSEWMHFIQALPSNSLLLGPASDLGQFLFGADRSALLRMATPFAEVQNGKCFYCERQVQSGEVDHFVPWSRYPVTSLIIWYWRIKNATATRAIYWPPRYICVVAGLAP